MAKPDITADQARELFDYDSVTGVLTRKPCRGTCWKPFAITHSRDDRGRGYLKTSVQKRSYLVHRLVWLIVHGDWPTHEIDHINRDAGDNRIENLRDVPRKVNLANRKSWAKPKPAKQERKGPIGWVEKDPSSAVLPYRARFQQDGQRINLGRFTTPEEARAALAAFKPSTGTFS